MAKQNYSTPYAEVSVKGLQPRSTEEKEKAYDAEKLETRGGKETWVGDKVGVGEGGIEGLNGYDYARAAAMLTDIAGLAGTAVFGAGNAVAATTGLVSTGLDLVADLEDGADWGDFGNFIVGAGLDIATLLPVIGSGAKAMKIAKGLKKMAPMIKTIILAGGVYGATAGMKGVYDKAQKNGWETLNMTDYSLIVRGLQGAVLSGRMAKNSASNAIAYKGIKNTPESLEQVLKTKRNMKKDALKLEGKDDDEIAALLDSDEVILKKSKNMWNKFTNYTKNSSGLNGSGGDISLRPRTKGTFQEIGMFGKIKNAAISDAYRRSKGRGILDPKGTHQESNWNAKNWKTGITLPKFPTGSVKNFFVGQGEGSIKAGKIAAAAKQVEADAASKLAAKVKGYNNAIQTPSDTPSFYNKPKLKSKVSQSSGAQFGMKSPDIMAPYRNKIITGLDITKMDKAQKRRLLDGGFKLSAGANKLLNLNAADIKLNSGYRKGGKLVQKFFSGGYTGENDDDNPYVNPRQKAIEASRLRKKNGKVTGSQYQAYGTESGAPTDEEHYISRWKSLQQQQRRAQHGLTNDDKIIIQGIKNGQPQVWDPDTKEYMGLIEWKKQKQINNTRASLDEANEDIMAPSLAPKIGPPGMNQVNMPEGFMNIPEYLAGRTPKEREAAKAQFGQYGDRKLYGYKGDKFGVVDDVYLSNGDGSIVTGNEANVLNFEDLSARRRTEIDEENKIGLAKMQSDEAKLYPNGMDKNSSKLYARSLPTSHLSKNSNFLTNWDATKQKQFKDVKNVKDYETRLNAKMPTLDELTPKTSKMKITDALRPNDIVQLGLLAAASKPTKAAYEEEALPNISPAIVRGLPKTVRDQAERAKAEVRSIDMDTSDPQERRRFLLAKSKQVNELESNIAKLETETIQQSRLAARTENFNNKKMLHEAQNAKIRAGNQREIVDAEQRAKAKSTYLQGIGTISAGIQERVDQKNSMDTTMKLMGAKHNIDMLKEENQYEYDKILWSAKENPTTAPSMLKLLSKQREGFNKLETQLLKRSSTI